VRPSSSTRGRSALSAEKTRIRRRLGEGGKASARHPARRKKRGIERKGIPQHPQSPEKVAVVDRKRPVEATKGGGVRWKKGRFAGTRVKKKKNCSRGCLLEKHEHEHRSREATPKMGKERSGLPGPTEKKNWASELAVSGDSAGERRQDEEGGEKGDGHRPEGRGTGSTVPISRKKDRDMFQRNQTAGREGKGLSNHSPYVARKSSPARSTTEKEHQRSARTGGSDNGKRRGKGEKKAT